jgi:type III pantothenate kinase
MTFSELEIASLDLGNSTCRMGLYANGEINREGFVETKAFISDPKSLIAQYPALPSTIAYCSVSPRAEESLKNWAKVSGLKLFNLNPLTCGNFPITYPHTNEIGQDRIANSLAAYKTCELPALVIDIGTATTFDVVGEKEGYAGGIIAPGPQGFLDFLHQNTALLPKVFIENKKIVGPIGKNTIDAMLLGAQLGFAPMVEGILKHLEKEMLKTHGKKPKVILAGGASHHLDIPHCQTRPFLTLEGVALAFAENNVIV